MSDRGAEARAGWGRWQRVKNNVIFGLASVAMWLVGRLPHRVALLVGSAAGLLGWAVAPFERRQTFENLTLAFPDLAVRARRRLCRRCFASLGRRAAEICTLGGLDLPRYVTLEDEDRRRIDTALAQGRGLLWVTAHLGNWELLAVGLGAQGYDVCAIATPSYDPRFTDIIHRWRLEYGRVRTLWRGRDDIGAGLTDALHSGAILGLLIDQDMKINGHFVPFFGKLAWTPSGAAVLARTTGAPVLTGFIHRRSDGMGHVIRVAEIDIVAGDDPEVVDRRNTALFTEAIEAAVRENPEEWVWMHRRWRTQPSSETSIRGAHGAHEKGGEVCHGS